MIVLDDDLALAIDAVRQAGELVMQYFGRDLVVEHKSPDQPLTAADLAADALLHDLLMGARPDYGWLSEETADRPDRLERSRVWIVDPIDGTRSFIAQLREFSISVGLAEDGVPVAGVVFNPARDELYYATAGQGAFMSHGGNDQRLRVSDRSTGVTMLASRSEIAAGEFEPFHDTWRVEPAGSTAYKLAGVAAGHGDAFVSRGPKSEWDICAGVLLVSEARGRATDIAGRDLTFNGADPYVHGIVATNGALHDTLLATIGGLPPSARMRAGPDDPLHTGLEEEE
jgi:myo-inositol-1(or 4)-monophosphatase